MNSDRILFGFTILMAINFFCVYAVGVFKIPLPAPLLGMIILSILLIKNIINTAKVKDACILLLEYMAMLFIPPAVGITMYYDIISSELLPVLATIFISSIIVMLVSGKIVQLMLVSKGGDKHE